MSVRIKKSQVCFGDDEPISHVIKNALLSGKQYFAMADSPDENVRSVFTQDWVGTVKKLEDDTK